MTNYIQKISFVLSLTLISCNAKNALSESTSKKEENRTVVPETDSLPVELNAIYQVFDNEFCIGFDDPRPLLNEHGFYVLDLKTYKDNLNSLNIFTKSFIDKQDEIFSECKTALENDSITPQDVPDGIDVSPPVGCGFFHFNYYLNTQERPDGFYVRNSKSEVSSGFAEIHFYTAIEDSFFTWDNQIVLRVYVQKAEGGWKINNVKK